ncbi:hypothetical protein F4679DRAFT_583919 [Xylaria curta]|nr:hypothetical protein F4679DRAFT_583919 [Xylaria curta]
MDSVTVEKLLAALDSYRSYFGGDYDVTEDHNDNLTKNLQHLGERTDLQGPVQSRHKAIRRCLTAIYRDSELGHEAFFLCALALSPTRLSGKDFVAHLRTWWKKAEISDHFHVITSRLQHQYRDLLPKEGSQGIKRRYEVLPCTEASPNDASSLSTYVPDKRRRRTSIAATVSDVDGRRSVSEEPLLNAPAEGVPYLLQLRDALLILATDNPEIRLTVPNSPTVSPFVTFHCSVKLARDIIICRPKERFM